MGNVLFPKLRGITWDIEEKLEFFNLTQKAVAPGYRTVISLSPDPIRHFVYKYSVLRQTSRGALFDEMKRLETFFYARKGDFDSFLLNFSEATQNLDDSVVKGQELIVDVLGYAPLIKTWVTTAPGDPTDTVYDQNIYEAAGVKGNPGDPPALTMNGDPLVEGVDYSWIGPGVAGNNVTYPGLVANITKAVTGPVLVDFNYYYRVKFEQNQLDFNLFMYLLWELKELQLQETRQ